VIFTAALPFLLDTAAPSAAAEPPAHDPDPCEAACEIGRFIDRNIGLTQIPVTIDQLRRFAKLQSETEKPAEGGGAVHELVYPGLVLRAYVPPAGAVLVEHIAVTGEAYKLPFGLRLGADPSVLQKLLGPPSETHPQPPDKTQWLYRNREGTASVLFAIAGDTRIEGVEWHFGGDEPNPPRASAPAVRQK
jgi:hypothetical protein